MKNMKKAIVTVGAFLLLSQTGVRADELADSYNPIPSSVQMLNIAPEARGTGMGDAGVASTPDMNSQYWNPAKYIRMQSMGGVTVNVTPWLRNIISDINLFSMMGYYKINQRNAVSAGIRYFSLGDLVMYNDRGEEQGSYKPNEFAIDGAYTLALSERLSGAISMRFIHSDLGFQVDDDGYSKGNAFAADVAFYWKKPIKISGYKGDLMFGVNLANIGTKITYDNGRTNEYLPANFRLGAGLWLDFDEYNRLGVALDFNKLMVPTPDYDKSDVTKMADDKRLEYYDKSVISSIFRSFTDAPGGFKEEMKEFDISGGFEYTYKSMFSARLGYHNNPPDKGNLKYMSAGVGVRYQMMEVNASYIFAVGNANRNSALANTIRISLGFDIGMVTNGRSGRGSFRR